MIEGSYVGQLRRKVNLLRQNLLALDDQANVQSASTAEHTIETSPNVRSTAMNGIAQHTHGPTGPDVEYLSLTAMSGPGFQSSTSEQNFGHINAQLLMSNDSSSPVDISTIENGPRELWNRLNTVLLNPIIQERLKILIRSHIHQSSSRLEIIQRQAYEQILSIFTKSSVNIESLQVFGQDTLTFILATSAMESLSHQYETVDDTLISQSLVSLQALNTSLVAEDHGTMIQSLTLQALLACHASDASVWRTLGLAFTKAISVGLHHMQAASTSGNFDQTSRLEIFWTLYSLDRALAFSLGRPFSIQDRDIFIKEPVLRDYTHVTNHKSLLAIVDSWIVRHARMLSSWTSPTAHSIRIWSSSLTYWRNTMSDIIDHTIRSRADGDFLGTRLRKEAIQLNCRALFQLAYKAKVSDQWECCRKQIATIEHQLTALTEKMTICNTFNSRHLSFIDGCDLFNIFVLFIYQRHIDNQHPSRVVLGISHMKMFMSANQLLADIGKRFAFVLNLKDMLWSFLSILENIQEQNFESHAVLEATTRLQTEVSECATTISTPAYQFMIACLLHDHPESTAN